ncbi:MAG: tRNA threonylcarbamoyladenosine dehydratase [Oscillospiraceae bacterium]|nr:tRNA threonylcarbamoyladenosine dehydratase [Oscillospiraceae bacterium]
MNIFSRTELILGSGAMKRLSAARVAVFGIGGVGGYTAEALARSGIGALDLIDNDTVSESNINRQIIALHSTVGRYKTEAAAERLQDINPNLKLTLHNTFFTPETASEFDFTQYDYVVDAIDTVTGKIELVMRAQSAGVPVISAMGAGNKLDPTAFEVGDIYSTSVCPLARVMRYELKKRGVKALKVVYSKEKPLVPAESGESSPKGKAIPGSTAFVPPVVGLIIAGEVVKDITGASSLK